MELKTDDLSRSAQDYLKVIWTLTEWSDKPVSTKSLAQRLGVRPPAVSEAVKRLSEQGLVLHERYGDVRLTPQGRLLALAMVRRHRLLETFLVQELGFGWDEVHAEADVLEHAVSDRLIDRIDARLGHPDKDPHGDPIPRPGGAIDFPPARRLSEMGSGETSTIQRISDANSDLLRYFGSVGLTVGSVVKLLERRDYADIVMVATSTGESAHLGVIAARSIWVSPPGAASD